MDGRFGTRIKINKQFVYTGTTILAFDKLAIAASIATNVTKPKFKIEVLGNAKAGSVTALDSTRGKIKAAVTIQVTIKAEQMLIIWFKVLFFIKKDSSYASGHKKDRWR